MTSSLRKISENDFTSCYIASDNASKSAQKSYVRLMLIDLISMVLAALLASHEYQSNDIKTILYVFTGLALLNSLILTVVLLTKKYEDTWYQGRALAESCKTLSWRFMTCAELFEHHISKEEARQRFSSRINDLNKEFSELSKVLDTDTINRPIITDFMNEIRSLSLEGRKKYYIDNRIEDQKTWYSQKAKFNQKKYNLWFTAIIISQALSLIGIVYMIKNPASDLNPVGLFTTMSAAAISWLQIKRYQELKQSYTTTSHELNSILFLSQDISTESEFSKFVLDSENAISREHTMWIAQRRK